MDGLFSPFHIILVLVAALVLFGPKRLPDIGKSLGKGIREFKGALTTLDQEDEAPAAQAVAVEEAPVPAPEVQPVPRPAVEVVAPPQAVHPSDATPTPAMEPPPVPTPTVEPAAGQPPVIPPPELGA
jgi:sec-independent protein translocase protein TatA